MNSLRSVREARINFIFFQDIITCVMGILILVTLMLSLSLGEEGSPEEQQLETELTQLKKTLADVEQKNRLAQQQVLLLASLPDRSALATEVTMLQTQATNAAEQLRRSEEASAALKTQEERAALLRRSATNLEQSMAALDKTVSDLKQELAVARRQTNALYIVPAPDARQSANQPVALVVSANKIQVKRLNAATSQERAISAGAADLRPLLAQLNPEREYIVFYFRPSGAKWFVPFRDLARSLGFTVGYDAVAEQQEIIFTSQ